MKKLFLLLLLIVIGSSIYSQDLLYDSPQKADSASSKKEKTAGYHLRRAGINFQLSVGASFISGLAVYGATLKDMDSETKDLLIVGAGVAAVSSLVAYLSGSIHIKKAGAAMEKRHGNLSFQHNHNGYGIVYSF
jgi:hypothetical protein